MPRSRVLSFMSQWGGPRSPTPADSQQTTDTIEPVRSNTLKKQQPPPLDTYTPQGSTAKLDSLAKASPTTATPSRSRADSRAASRPMSMVQTHNPPQMEMTSDTPPELMPIFSFLNSHSNKLYQEGYFLKLHDLDSRGRPSPDRVWLECFAQLVGTVLSLWDAAALDAAGEDGEVVPTFINLSDASIKMIESLPMSGAAGGNLQNVLSISTAANNRYLLHFNSLSSLTQWTAGIRLAMYEHATLQEAYTGSLIAGKGRNLNNIKAIMERSKFQHDDWARVRFGAGTPWKRCWCVVSPPDEKAFAKAQKEMKKSAYEKVKMPKGDIKFYDTRKVTKKTRPIATISDAYAAYAIYPQSKPLVDQSTLVKLEGLVTVHDSQEQTSEGFVFVMPEVHAAVSGFEMLLRWLFPVWDTFALYGRPTRLIADTLDQRGLMFAMPQDRRYGYLDILDVSGMIHTKGSADWTERQWRRELKRLTSERMNHQMDGSPQAIRHASQRRATTSRASLPQQGGVRFGDDYVQSQPGSRSGSPGPMNNMIVPPKRTDSAPPGAGHISSPHKRSVSEAQGYKRYNPDTPSRLSEETGGQDEPPPPPRHGGALGSAMRQDRVGRSHGPGSLPRIESESTVPTLNSTQNDMQMQASSPHLSPPQPVGSPPAFVHSPNSRPATQPYAPPELRRAHSNVDVETLYQMQDAARRDRTPDAETPEEQGHWNGEVQQRQQNTVASNTANRNLGVPADRAPVVLNRADHADRDPRQRLSTIPGSPYIAEDAETFQAAPVVPMAAVSEERQASPERGESESPLPTPAISLHSKKSLIRKPVPPRSESTIEQATPPVPLIPTERTQSNLSTDSPSPVAESWEGGYIDDEALERVLGGSRSNTMQTAESSEPDYASTVSVSTRGKKSIERPRAGKLKTVGVPDMPTMNPHSGGAGKLDTWAKEQEEANAEIPGVDFGPTLQYKPSSRPGTSGTLMPGDRADKRRSTSVDALRSKSKDRLSGAFHTPGESPNESKRNSSYFTGRNTPSPGRGLTPDPAGRLTPDAFGRLSPAGSAGAANAGRRSVTPEEWVAQRANAAHQTQYAPPRKPVPNLEHMRSLSTNSVKQRNRLTKTPPLGRTLSGDWTNMASGRETPPSRPQSRGAGVNLDLANASLTAREQMQVSRATGTPLVDLAKGKKPKPKEEDHGLVGAVAARERDKAASKSNRNSMAVQQAIVERQQQQMRAEAEAQAHAQAQAQAQYQAQVQATHQQRMQAMQQQMYYAQQGQQQQQQYPPQRPNVQTQARRSWYGGQPTQQQQQYQPPPQGYYAASPAAYSPGAGYGPPQQQQQQQGFAPPPYGASFYAQQQQQQQGGQAQGQQQRQPSKRASWMTWR